MDSGGVTFGSGGGYTLGGTAGQPDAATWSGGGYTLDGGFWHAASAGAGRRPAARRRCTCRSSSSRRRLRPSPQRGEMEGRAQPPFGNTTAGSQGGG